MIQKRTDTIIPVTTNRATKYSELIAAGWTEESICLTLSDDQQAFKWNAAIKRAVQTKHCKVVTKDKDGKEKVSYAPIPNVLTAAMRATAEEFARNYPNSFHRFSTESGPGKGWLERAKASGSITKLATLKGAARESFLAEFKTARGFDCTVENIAAQMKRDFEAAPKGY